MLKRCLIAETVLVILTVLSASTVCGQTYPTKPIRIVTSDPGGGNDFTARLIAQGLTISLGQQVIVDNRPAGVIPGEIVSKARPDGHTLLLYGNNLWIGQFLQNTPYDAVRDFSPITMISRAPNVGKREGETIQRRGGDRGRFAAGVRSRD